MPETTLGCKPDIKLLRIRLPGWTWAIDRTTRRRGSDFVYRGTSDIRPPVEIYREMHHWCEGEEVCYEFRWYVQDGARLGDPSFDWWLERQIHG